MANTGRKPNARSLEEEAAPFMGIVVKVGRPTKYYEGIEAEVLELGALGKSYAQIASHFNVDKATLRRWEDAYPEFRTAINTARVKAQDFWEQIGQKGMISEDPFNAQIWRTSMQARFRDDYTERTQAEISGPNGGAIQTESVQLEEMSIEQREALELALAAAAAALGGDYE